MVGKNFKRPKQRLFLLNPRHVLTFRFSVSRNEAKLR